MHRVLWQKGEIFEQIFMKYSSYLSINYPDATVVFDGYEDQYSTKDSTHTKRTRSVGKVVHFIEKMPLTSRKEEFLSKKITNRSL